MEHVIEEEFLNWLLECTDIILCEDDGGKLQPISSSNVELLARYKQEMSEHRFDGPYGICSRCGNYFNPTIPGAESNPGPCKNSHEIYLARQERDRDAAILATRMNDEFTHPIPNINDGGRLNQAFDCYRKSQKQLLLLIQESRD